MNQKWWQENGSFETTSEIPLQYGEVVFVTFIIALNQGREGGREGGRRARRREREGGRNAYSKQFGVLLTLLSWAIQKFENAAFSALFNIGAAIILQHQSIQFPYSISCYIVDSLILCYKQP